MESTALTPIRQAHSVVIPTAPRKQRPQRVKVLVLLHPDAFVEVFATDNVQAVVINTLDSTADPNLLDAYLEGELPRTHKPLLVPRNVRAVGNWERRTTAGEIDRLERLALLRDIQGRRK